MLYLVTGGAGFIGSSLAEALLARGDHVRIVDDFSTGRRENLSHLDGYELIEGSLVDSQVCAKAVRGVRGIFHQAAIPSVPRSIEAPVESHQANVDATLNLLVAARDAKVGRVVYAASSSAYGDSPTLPKVESMNASPKSPYAVQKHCSELYMRVFYEAYGLETVSLRYFNIFGPRQDPASEYSAVIPKFITRMLQGQRPTIYGDGTQSRDFTYIENVVHANLLALDAPADRAAGEVVNIACGESTTLLRLVEVIGEILGVELSAEHEPERTGDVKHSFADLSKAKKVLDYEPVVSFADGIAKTIDWYRASSFIEKA